MLQYFRLPSGSASLSIGYITGGILMIIWTIVWLTYMMTNDTGSQGQYYICGGLIVSGVAFLVIGTLMGRIGEQAKGADSDTAAPINTGHQGVVAGMQAPVVGQMPMQQPGTPMVMVPASTVANQGQAPQPVPR